MKKSFLLFVALSCIICTAYSQITIESDDIITIGVVANQTTDTLPDASILEGGVGQWDWDFTALAEGEDVQFVFLDPATTPYGTSFPDANLATLAGPDLYAYMIKNDTVISIIGVEGTQEISGSQVNGQLTLTPGQSLIRFPATFGDSFQETVVQQGQVPGADVGFPTIDSIRLVTTTERIVEIDAYGIMQTPSGTYNTIRSTEREASQTQVFNYNNGEWLPFFSLDPDTVVNFNWWTLDNGTAFPVVQLQFSPVTGSRRVTWLKSLTAIENLFESEAALYPNPTSRSVTIDFDEPFTGSVEVYNFKGQLLLSQNINALPVKTINVSALPSGLHLIVIKDPDGRLAGFEKLEIVK